MLTDDTPESTELLGFCEAGPGDGKGEFVAEFIVSVYYLLYYLNTRAKQPNYFLNFCTKRSVNPIFKLFE